MRCDRTTSKRLSAGGLAAGAVAMVISVLDGSERSFDAGLLLGMVSATLLVLARCCIAEDVLERVRQDAYDDGYRDGCDASRPARVVGLAGTRFGASSGRGLTLDGPPHQLGQQGHVRS